MRVVLTWPLVNRNCGVRFGEIRSLLLAYFRGSSRSMVSRLFKTMTETSEVSENRRNRGVRVDGTHFGGIKVDANVW